MLLPLSTFNDFLSFLLFKRLRLNNLTIYITHTNKVIDIKLLEFYCRFYVTLPDISFTRLSPREKTKEVVSSEGGKSRSEEKLVNEKDGGINRSWLRETRGCTRWLFTFYGVRTDHKSTTTDHKTVVFAPKVYRSKHSSSRSSPTVLQ